jgi:hypothetical protein
LASTIFFCRPALASRAQIRDLRIDSRGSLLWSASVTHNFGNHDNLGRGAPEREKEWKQPHLMGSKGTQAIEEILRRCLSARLPKLSRLSVSSFGVGCCGRISQGASESSAPSTQRTWKYDGYSEECSFEYPAWQDRSVTQTSSGVLIWRCKLQCHIHAVSTRRSLTGEPIYRHDRYREKPFSMRFST